jgi:hypothetical protein
MTKLSPFLRTTIRSPKKPQSDVDNRFFPNGNWREGTEAQDWVCTSPAGLLNYNPKTLACCIEHDAGYAKNGCNASSWKTTALTLTYADELLNGLLNAIPVVGQLIDPVLPNIPGSPSGTSCDVTN